MHSSIGECGDNTKQFCMSLLSVECPDSLVGSSGIPRVLSATAGLDQVRMTKKSDLQERSKRFAIDMFVVGISKLMLIPTLGVMTWVKVSTIEEAAEKRRGKNRQQGSAPGLAAEDEYKQVKARA